MDEQIRSGKESDAAAIVAVIRQWKVEERKTPIDGGAVERVVRLCTQSRGCDVLIAEAHGTILGYVIVHWIPFPMLGGVEGYISDLLVGIAGRGAGVGSRLITKVESMARDKGCVRLMLNNRMAAESFKRQFYPKHGFQRRDEFANMVKMLG